MAPFPLANGDISEVILEKNYTDALTLQTIISEMTESNLIIAEKKHNRTYLTLSDDGLNTIDALEDRISDTIKSDINTYITGKKGYYIDKHATQTSYSLTEKGEYMCEFTGRDNSGEVLNIRITLPTEEMAKNACEKFQKENIEIYKFLIDRLLS